jgi:A/G-specific adenine glycosylase
MKELNDWFRKNRRDFPWRLNPTPYQVWVSEVMLQQTRASVVIPYFAKWMELFPDVKTLAAAKIETVIKAWEGLGYYSRARNLHLGAVQIMEKFAGKIPSTQEELQQIRGLGPYTIGAILSFGFKQKSAAVDGNVARVLSRFFLITENIDRQPTKKRLWQQAEEVLDPIEPWVTAEALIELGATICTPKPRCEDCPLQFQCQGKHLAESLPIKNKERETIYLKRAVLWLEAEGKILVKKGEKGKVMADLYEFPYFEVGTEIWGLQRMDQEVTRFFNMEVERMEKLPRIIHTFTRYQAELYPFRYQAKKALPTPGYEWIERDLLSSLPFSSGHRRILQL